MTLRTAVTARFGIDHPVVLAPMGGEAVELVNESADAAAVVAQIVAQAERAIATVGSLYA